MTLPVSLWPLKLFSVSWLYKEFFILAFLIVKEPFSFALFIPVNSIYDSRDFCHKRWFLFFRYEVSARITRIWQMKYYVKYAIFLVRVKNEIFKVICTVQGRCFLRCTTLMHSISYRHDRICRRAFNDWWKWIFKVIHLRSTFSQLDSVSAFRRGQSIQTIIPRCYNCEPDAISRKNKNYSINVGKWIF